MTFCNGELSALLHNPSNTKQLILYWAIIPWATLELTNVIFSVWIKAPIEKVSKNFVCGVQQCNCTAFTALQPITFLVQLINDSKCLLFRQHLPVWYLHKKLMYILRHSDSLPYFRSSQVVRPWRFVILELENNVLAITVLQPVVVLFRTFLSHSITCVT